MALKDLRPALREFLLTDTAIAAAVGRRVFPMQIPQGVRGDAIVYQRISATADHHMQGASGYMVHRMQITAWAGPSIDEAEALALAVQARLDGYRGLMPLPTSPASLVPPVKVWGVFLDLDNPPDYDETRLLYGVARDYMIHFAQR